jgi:hypothetical protein
MTPVPVDAVCRLHASTAAAICSRCGVFVCELCRTRRLEQDYCPDCATRAKAAATQRAITAVVLAYCGLQFCFPIIGVIGLVMAQDERRKIADGSSTAESEGYVKWAIILGWINVGALGLMAVVGLAAVIAFSHAR